VFEVTIYRHTQFGYAVTGILEAGVVLLVSAGLILGWVPAVTAVRLTFVLLFPIFSFMAVKVDERYLSFRLGVFPLIKRVPVRGIQETKPVRDPWFHGRGIHMIYGGWLYNVSGNGAVEIRFTSGASFRIGTDEPERLISAVSQARGTAS
jgi:hypothetical protein